MNMFDFLHIILVETRFPENIGSAARASANFGSASILLVKPEMWQIEKASPLATKQGIKLLNEVQVFDTVQDAVKDCVFCVGTSARTGGFRREIQTPKECAREIIQYLQKGEHVALLFGPEDRGLENQHLEHCHRLVTIPTSPDCASLNLAQAVLLMMYEIYQLAPEKHKMRQKDKGAMSRRITIEERTLLHEKLKKILTQLDVIQESNPDYFFLPMARFLDRKDIRRHEMDMLLGICRQVERLTRSSAEQAGKIL